MRNTHLSTVYWKIKQRRGSKKAIIALARKLLTIIYNMLKNSTEYDESLFEQVKQKQENLRKKRLINEAKKLGLELVERQSA